MTDEQGATPGVEERDFEDLTLAEMIGDLLRQPFETLRVLRAVTNPARKAKRTRVRRPVDAADETEADDITPDAARQKSNARLSRIRFGLMFWAFVSAMIGNLTLVNPSPGPRLGLLRDMPVSGALFFWLLAVALVIYALRFVRPAVDDDFEWRELSEATGVRPLYLAAAMPLLVAAFILSTGNTFTLPGVAAWAAGIAAVGYGFAPHGVSPVRAVRRGIGAIRRFRVEEPRVALLLLAVVLIGAYARFNGLGDVPAEMTSDHIEKLLDAQRVSDGARDIFFANNGGREPFQMYFVALLGKISQQPLGFAHLKIAAALESLLGLPLLFILGRVAIGERDRRLGTMLGLTLALFAAVGFWHIAITRVSLRIMLTPLVTTVFLIYLIRLIRFNRREDAIMAGLTIGVGLYAYQALRMLPVVAVVAVLYMIVFAADNRRQRWAAAFNLAVIAVVAFAVFVPLFKYSTEHPEEFWRRAQGRLLGDDVITETLADGTIVARSPTLIERATALIGNVPALGQNMMRALGMFTYRGDVAWLHNAPNYPAFDPVTGAFLIIGAVGWLIWAVQRREHTAVFLLVVLVLMLLPSAVAIANPGENPSHTRTSGAMPVAYLLSAFGAVRLAAALGEAMGRGRMLAAGVVIGGAAAVSLGWANTVVFGPYNDFYQNSWSPQREAGEFLRGVAESDGAWGNVYVLAAAHFFDYRGLAIEAGLAPGEFHHGDIPFDMLLLRLRGAFTRTDKFRLDPDRYVVVIYHYDDAAVSRQLQEWFPEGREMVIDTRQDTPWLFNERYRTFRIPPLGADAWRAFLTEHGMTD